MDQIKNVREFREIEYQFDDNATTTIREDDAGQITEVKVMNIDGTVTRVDRSDLDLLLDALEKAGILTRIKR